MILDSREVERSCKTQCPRFDTGKSGQFSPEHNVRANVIWTELSILNKIKIKQKRIVTMANNRKQRPVCKCYGEMGEGN